MKQITLTLLFVCFSMFTMVAQNQKNIDKNATTQTQQKQVASAQTHVDCPDLLILLSKEFGNDFSFSDAKVKEKLKRNITDESLNRCIRKSSLKLVYGEDYINKLNLIEPKK